jgi:hypothetical protein
MKNIFTSKLGTAKGKAKSRIWIEGKRLINAGFTPGKYYIDAPGESWLHLHLLNETDIIEPGQTPRKVSGKGANPIIDLTGQWVFEMFGKDFERVSVEYRPGLIIIKGAADA